MKITKVETFVAGQDLKEPFSFSQWEYSRRETCLVRITTDDGSYGWGEGYGPAKVLAAGIAFLTPLIQNKNPLEISNLWDIMHKRSYDYARSGVLVASRSAIDIALWDLKGKILCKPVCELLGTRQRDRVEVYATGMYFTHCDDLPAKLAHEAADYVQRGFSAMKMKVGLGLDADMRNICAVRDAIGPQVRLMVDANHAFTRTVAMDYIRAMDSLDIAWFEEPISPDDYAGNRKLCEASPIPIASGECDYLCAGFQRLFEAGAVNIAQPDIGASGGLTEAIRIATLAQQFKIPLTPHCWGSGLALAAAVHFMAVQDVLDGQIPQPLEMDQTENPLRDELVMPAFRPIASHIDVPTAPGLGVDVDLEKLSQCI